MSVSSRRGAFSLHLISIRMARRDSAYRSREARPNGGVAGPGVSEGVALAPVVLFSSRQYQSCSQAAFRLESASFGKNARVKVLLVEDDKRISSLVKRGLEAEGFTVDVALNGNDGLWLAREGSYDVVVLDIMLPGRNGYQVCAELREAGDWTPILMLTAKDGEHDEAEALDTGADDYLTKPFSFVVLVARIRALLRRSGREPVPVEAGDLRLDPAQRRVWREDVEVELTARQFDVLEFLMRRNGEVISKLEILNGVWEFGFEGDPNIVEVYIRRLRARIDEPFGRHAIETVRGAGYRLRADGG